jgi:hypothetical protein
MRENYGYGFCTTRTIECALKIADPSSRQRGCPTETRQQLSDSNLQTGSNIWLQVRERAQHQDVPTD